MLKNEAFFFFFYCVVITYLIHDAVLYGIFG